MTPSILLLRFELASLYSDLDCYHALNFIDLIDRLRDIFILLSFTAQLFQFAFFPLKRCKVVFCGLQRTENLMLGLRVIELAGQLLQVS